MASSGPQSVTARVLRTVGVGVVWAAGFTLLLGLPQLSPREPLEEERRPLLLGYRAVEALEWRTVDARARAVGASAPSREEVVLVRIDEETVGNARLSPHLEWATRPWPRALLASVVAELLDEGAAAVVVDVSLASPSPASCGLASTLSDDVRFQRQLEELGPRVILTAEASDERTRPPERPLAPLLVQVAPASALDGGAGVPEVVRGVLAQRATAYADDAGVWAGVSNADEGQLLLRGLGLRPGAPVTRALTPQDEGLEWTAGRLAWAALREDWPMVDVEALPTLRRLEVPVPEALPLSVRLGVATLEPDWDGVVRRVRLVSGLKDGAPVGSAALRAVQALKPVTLGPGRTVEVDGRRLVLDRDWTMALRWEAGEPGSAGRGPVRRVVPAWRVLLNREDTEEGRTIRHFENELEGRVVILSDEAEESQVRTALGLLPRSTVLAQAVLNLLDASALRQVPRRVNLALVGALAVLGALVALALSRALRVPGWLAWVGAASVVAVGYWLWALQLAQTQGRMVAVVAPLLAFGFTLWASLGYARGLQASVRDFLGRALGGAVQGDMLGRVERDISLMRPERRQMTVLFADIDGFTELASEAEPRLMVQVLRDYLSRMTDVVLDRQGLVDKYLGDGVMAFWGAPVLLPEQVPVACEAALGMVKSFEANRASWEEKLKRPLALRAGLDTGPTVVGEMGTLHRINYTVMGEPVAAAFRLEEAARAYGARILVGPQVPAAAGPRFAFREVDRVEVKRGEEPVPLYELMGRVGEVDEARLSDWRQAVQRYREGDFAGAQESFARLQAAQPEAVVTLYLERCQKALQHVPW